MTAPAQKTIEITLLFRDVVPETERDDFSASTARASHDQTHQPA